MLEWSQQNSFDIMLPFLALSGLRFLRTSELVSCTRMNKFCTGPISSGRASWYTFAARTAWNLRNKRVPYL